MNEKKLSVNQQIAMTGAFGALSIVLSLTPLGYIQLGGFITLTIMHIPVILATVIAGLIPGLGTGLIFGLSSLLRTVMNGGGATPFFLDPRVSVIPRILFPVVVWLIFKLMCLIPKMPKIISGSVAAGLGTLAHTVMVMGSIYIFYGEPLLAGMTKTLEGMGYDISALTGFGGFAAIIVCTLATNGLWEIIAAVILTATVMLSIFAGKGRKSKLSRIEDKN